jgi:PIN domain nuclease of toxin-antitoxin system
MKGLLDTHAFLWMDSDPSRLSAAAQTFIRDPVNTLLLSVASIWEMQIKLQLGKLSLTMPLAVKIGSQQTNGVQVLPVELNHVLALTSLPNIHKDPFDRLLIAQANCEGALLITADPVISKYPVQTVW